MAEEGGAARPAKSSKEKFVRPVGVREHYLGVAIICLVIVICTWVIVRGNAPAGHMWGAYDPSLFADTSAGAPAADRPADTAEPAPALVDTTEESAAGPAAAAPAGAPVLGLLPLEAPAGYTAGQVETFDAKTMYEKIDGRAEAYVVYDVLGMECQAFTQGDAVVEVFVLDMGTPLQAFGSFSSERNAEKPVALGQSGYSASGSVYFWQQRYYAQIMNGTGSSEGGAVALALAQQLAAKLPSGKVELPGVAWFPAEGLVPDSVAWVKKSALGQQFLDDTWTAKYDVGGVTVEAFLSRRNSPSDAESLKGKYREFLASIGPVAEETIGGVPAVVSENSGVFDVVFARGEVFGGVSYVEGRVPAETVIARLAAAP